MKYLLKAAALASGISLLAVLVYPVLEPGLVLAQTDSDNVVVSLTVDSGISISDASNTSMSPNLSVSNDTSTGSTSWTVTTNDNAGYTLAVKATSSPALQNTATSDAFDDYSEAVSGTPDSWSVDSGKYEFGFSSYGTDVSTATWGSGGTCGSGDPGTTSMNYLGFTTSDKQIASRATTTPYAGVDTTVCFGAEQNTVFAPSGTYQATVVATATVQ